MEITGVRVFPVHEDKLKAFVSIVFDHCFMVNDIKVIQGRDSLFISMPSRRKRNGEYKDIAHPLNNETRRMLEERILDDYRTAVAGEDMQEEKREEEPSELPEEVAPDAPVPEAPAPEMEAVSETPRPEVAADDKSLEEVTEAHLRDSFWSVP